MSARDPVPSRQDLAVCAHDLRGALTVINGYTGLLRRGGLDAAEKDAALTGIEAAVRRIDHLIADTLAGRAAPPPASAVVDVTLLAKQAVADARVAFGRDVRLSGDANARVDCDEIALARVLENLLSNAARYAPKGPIEVVVACGADVVIIDVADRGPGIAESDRQAAFEPFVRLGLDDKASSTGLGLTVVRSVVERCGGQARILGRDGGGTVVRLELPASP